MRLLLQLEPQLITELLWIQHQYLPPPSRWRSVAVCAIRMHSCPRGGADGHVVRTHKVSICIRLDCLRVWPPNVVLFNPMMLISLLSCRPQDEVNPWVGGGGAPVTVLFLLKSTL